MKNCILRAAGLLVLVFSIAAGQTGGFVSTRGADIIAPDGKAILLEGSTSVTG